MSTWGTALGCGLAYYDDDALFRWHRQFLAMPFGDSRWVCGRPDHEGELGDLAGHDVRPSRRGALLPAVVSGNLYAFDPLQLDVDGRNLGADLGVPVDAVGGVAVVVEVRRISSSSSSSLDSEVPPGALADKDAARQTGEAFVLARRRLWARELVASSKTEGGGAATGSP